MHGSCGPRSRSAAGMPPPARPAGARRRAMAARHEPQLGRVAAAAHAAGAGACRCWRARPGGLPVLQLAIERPSLPRPVRRRGDACFAPLTRCFPAASSLPESPKCMHGQRRCGRLSPSGRRGSRDSYGDVPSVRTGLGRRERARSLSPISERWWATRRCEYGVSWIARREPCLRAGAGICPPTAFAWLPMSESSTAEAGARRSRDYPWFVRPAVTPLARARPELLRLDSIPCLEVDACSCARAVVSVFAGGPTIGARS
jgi:hypothetical protein